LIYECWRADPVDGITGEEDQERDEEFTSPDVGYTSRSDIESVAYATGGGFLSTDVQFEDDDEALTPVELLLYEHFRYLGCPSPVDPVDTDDCAGMAVEVIRFLTEKGVIVDREAAYRAGREDAARDILDVLRQREDAARETYARRRALGVGDQAAEWAVRSRAWRQARQAAEEAAIAVGDGVQPTEEQPDE
jgi:hypothetical protein